MLTHAVTAEGAIVRRSPFLLKARIMNPGVRGGDFRRTDSGEIRYDKAGEGIIGHTRSQKPVFHPTHAHANLQGRYSHLRYPHFTAEDHADAADLHRKERDRHFAAGNGVDALLHLDAAQTHDTGKRIARDYAPASDEFRKVDQQLAERKQNAGIRTPTHADGSTPSAALLREFRRIQNDHED